MMKITQSATETPSPAICAVVTSDDQSPLLDQPPEANAPYWSYDPKRMLSMKLHSLELSSSYSKRSYIKSSVHFALSTWTLLQSMLPASK